MTFYPSSASPPLGSYRIHFVSDAGDSVPLPTRGSSLRRVATVMLVIAAVVAVVIALSITARPAHVPTAAPVRGESGLSSSQPAPGVIVSVD
jgi:hypothetical protein